jgi:hypothetical protein
LQERVRLLLAHALTPARQRRALEGKLVAKELLAAELRLLVLLATWLRFVTRTVGQLLEKPESLSASSINLWTRRFSHISL